MVMAISLIVGLSCGPSRIINDTDEWNKIDQASYESAFLRCSQLYKHSPCLKVFRKLEENLYASICGSNRDNDRWNELNSLTNKK